jgi:hypothetical protein
MMPFKRNRVVRRLLVPGVCLAALLCSAAPSVAQPPRKGDGPDIKSRMDAVLAKHEILVNTLKERFSHCVGRNCDVMQEHLKKVESAHQRAKTQHAKFSADDYAVVNKKQRVKCKGKNCVQDPEELTVQPESDTGLGEDMSGQLDEIEQGIDMTTTLLSEPGAGPVALGMARSLSVAGAGFQPLYDYKNDADYPAWLHVADNPRAIIPTAFAMSIAATTSQAIANTILNVCQLDVFGVNVSIACLPLDILAIALEATSRLLNYNLSDATAWDAKGAYERAANLNANLALVDGRVGEVGTKVGGTAAVLSTLNERAVALDARLAATRRRLLVAQNQIIQLLLTPEGQRKVSSNILTCDGSVSNPCPTISIECSPTTGVCTAR